MTPHTGPGGPGDLVRRHLAAIAAIGERPTGSEPNRHLEAYLGGVLRDAGCGVERLAFSCEDWRAERVFLRCGEDGLVGVANPYSLPCDVEAGVVAASSDEGLATLDGAGRIVVLHGPLTVAPWMPEEFPFFSDEAVRARVRRLRAMGPAAVITVSPRLDFPVPVIIDGSFGIPSCTVGPVAGARLLSCGDEPARLAIGTVSLPVEAADVIGRIGGDGPCIVVSAHLDTKHLTPGALDNATGLAVLLALAERFAADPPCPLEFTCFNGEEHYAAPGEVAYIGAGHLDPARVRLVVNLDGIGLAGHPASLAFFACPPALESGALEVLARHPDLVRVDPWPGGDHMVFCMGGVPGMAVSTAAPPDVLDAVLHTPADTLDRVDVALVARTARAVEALIRAAADLLGLSPPRPGGRDGPP
ncbi:MAG TPA: M28 family peptidase [Methanoregulaceae archaeon]|nr:M28 family peptidase [Methanoregulaceae archaeon]HQJ88416.1 M28 family peptidase [Methanoregulaceae archaeon]